MCIIIIILQTLVYQVLDSLYSCFSFSIGLMLTWRRHDVNNAPLVDHAVELCGGELRALISDDFGWNKMNLELDDDILGRRAGQVVDLDERSTQLSQGTAVHSVQPTFTHGLWPSLCCLIVSFWLWVLICWHASQCSAVCFMTWAIPGQYDSSRARINMLS